MNQLLVTSNGGAGRALFKLAGARALSVPASAALSLAVAGCSGPPKAEAPTLAAYTPTDVEKAAAEAMAARITFRLIIGRLRGRYLDSGVPRRAGRSNSVRPSASVIDTKMPDGSPLRTGFTTTDTLSPGLMVLDFHPARIR